MEWIAVRIQAGPGPLHRQAAAARGLCPFTHERALARIARTFKTKASVTFHTYPCVSFEKFYKNGVRCELSHIRAPGARLTSRL